MEREFTITDAYKIQQENLYEWSLVLNIEAYALLLRKVIDGNKGINSPYQVPRGADISQYVSEIMREMAKNS